MKYKKLASLKPTFFYALLIVVLWGSCEPPSSNNMAPRPIHQTPWSNYLNEQIDSLGEVYAENALKINTQGAFIGGKLAIVEHYDSLDWHIDSIKWSETIIAKRDSSIEYAIGSFWTTNHGYYKQLLINDCTTDIPLVELEFTARAIEGAYCTKGNYLSS